LKLSNELVEENQQGSTAELPLPVKPKDKTTEHNNVVLGC
jgi:hypothetical protein